MADSKLTALSELTQTSGSDILYIVDDPGGTPVGKKIQATNLVPKVKTVYASSTDAHTTNNTWEDINSMSITLTSSIEDGKLLCMFTVRIQPKSANWEHFAFRFVLDGSTYSESWLKNKNNNPTDTTNVYVEEIHTVFENVSAASHTVKVQWYDNNSSLDADILDRRLTVMTCQ